MVPEIVGLWRPSGLRHSEVPAKTQREDAEKSETGRRLGESRAIRGDSGVSIQLIQ